MKLKVSFCTVLMFFVLISQSECSKKKVKLENKNVELETANVDPCKDVKCISGKECIIDPETETGKCMCIRECAENTDLRRRVCSNHNETWQSDCHLLKHRCDCVEGISSDCVDDHKHMHINYYGVCKEIEECKQEILEDFPRRMREWLDNIISKRLKQDSTHEQQAYKWIDAIIWKFCDVDQEPKDRHVSRHELFPLRAPLLSMESCIADFLDGCDADNDHKITLKEWGKCLGATDSELENKCNKFIQLADLSAKA